MRRRPLLLTLAVIAALVAIAGVVVLVMVLTKAPAEREGAAANAPKRRAAPSTSPHRPLPCEGAACEPRCDAGDFFACHRIAQTTIVDGKVKPAMLALFEKACDGKVGAACFSLGDIYATATSVPKDEARAKQLYARAFELSSSGCDDDGSLDCTILAMLYAAGKGTEKSEARAQRSYERAEGIDRDLCEQGRADACVVAARGYRYPHKAPEPREAARLYGKACDLGDKAACGMRDREEARAAKPSGPASAPKGDPQIK